MTGQPGFLIALEGIDGCGKSTQQQQLAARLRELGHAVVTLREPGDTEPGRELRRIFVEGRDVTPEREMRLFLEDRRIDVRERIAPALATGKIVVMDRYYLSSVVYQGSLDLDPQYILAANEEFAPRPDLTLILDIDPEVARARIRAARGSTNTFEDGEYLARVRAAYLGFVDGDRIRCVDAARPPGEINDDLMEAVVQLLEAG